MKRLLSVLALCALFSQRSALAQNTPTLTITSPSSRLIIQPGQTLIIDVTGTNPPAGSKEALIVTDPIPSAYPQTSAARNEFQITIPANISPGSYSITAAESSSGGLVTSAPVVVKIVPNYNFDALNAQLKTMMFIRETEGRLPLVISGSTNGVSKLISNEFLTFNSANPAVATVDKNGIVTPNSPGQTKVTFSYGNVMGSVDVLVGPNFGK